MKNFLLYSLLISGLLLAYGCQPKEEPHERPSDQQMFSGKEYSSKGLNFNEWMSRSVLYEVNLRQYTGEGTINAFRTHLPRLKELGVDVLWFMPIHPIGLENRKEDSSSLGSYYSVKDYKAVNPDLGTKQDFKALVEECHQTGFKVVLDWVANHTAWDHKWVESNPEFYTADEEGNRPVVALDNEGNPTDWTDVADLDYNNPGLRSAMTDALSYWVDSFDIDGYRFDVAGFVPLDYWTSALPHIQRNKRLYLLGEWEDHRYYEAMDFLYGWNFHHHTNQLAKGEIKVEKLYDLMEENNLFGGTENPEGDFHHKILFTTNHDENSWNGTVFERYGDAHKCFAALCFTLPGMPLIYSGQEVGLDRRLSFFGKDQIDWSDQQLSKFYAGLCDMRHHATSLRIGPEGGTFEPIHEAGEGVFAFYREGSEESLLAIFNLSDKGMLTDFGAHQEIHGFTADDFNGISLDPWEYKLLFKPKK